MTIIKRFIISIFVILVFSCSAWAGPQGTSGVTTGQIEEDALYRLGSYTESGVTDPFFSSSEILQWINDGMVDISKKTGCLQTTEDVTLVADTLEYTLTSNYLEVKGCILTDSDGDKIGLKEGNVWSVGRVESSFKPASRRKPEFWYEFDGKVGFYPMYSSVTGEVVTTYLSLIPAEISSGATITTPQIYDQALIFYVVAQGLLKDGRSDEYQLTDGKYMDELGLSRRENEPAKETDEVIE